ncbi:LOW QUALITY PROTEIN: peptide methionine sulfoxide reductase MsrB [Geomicrobium sp. JCM 19037]|nr:LOW QUALITY PROTEIN: peptide methionine sulfoxide reductase MsrB [Geomicrobium sp. JCM 19037]
MTERQDQNLKEKLTKMQYEVTQNDATEPPFQNEYWNHFEEGLYVDIISGKPLFTSKEKFESSCGWPSFTKPVDEKVVAEKVDTSHGEEQKEATMQIHTAMYPRWSGTRGLRYCINSASIRFVPYDQLDEFGYGEYKNRIKDK